MNGSVGHLAAFHRPEHTEEDRTACPILFRESMRPCVVRRIFYPFAMAMQNEISLACNKEMEGRDYEVIVEGPTNND